MTERQDAQEERPGLTLKVTIGSKDDDLETFTNDLQRFQDRLRRHKDGGPDLFVVEVVDPRVMDSVQAEDPHADKTLLRYRVTFAPGKPPHTDALGRPSETDEEGSGQHVRFVLADEVAVLDLPHMSAEDWQDLVRYLTQRNSLYGLTVPSFPLKRNAYFHAPGRLLDTPRYAVKQDDLPAISRWYTQTAFNRVVAMAAAALTKADTREAALGWQSATIDEVMALVYWREDGTPAHGQYRQDILHAFEALRAIPIPIVRIDWVQVGTARNPRWRKEYKLRVMSMLQGYGPVFVEKSTGKEVYVNDPFRKKDLVKKRPPRKKALRELLAQNIGDTILESFPPDRFTLTRFEWQWNTNIAEDFICPQVALDDKQRPRRKLKKGFHFEGSRFINLHRRYFEIQKHLRSGRYVYAPSLLDFIVSEKTHIKSRGKGAVWIEIQADAVVKYLGLWQEYEGHPKHVLEDHLATAVKALIAEGVLLSGSWELPKQDHNPDRRKALFYRWKVAELWSTVALVTPEEAKAVAAEYVTPGPAAAAGQRAAAPGPAEEQTVLPGMTALAVPSGADVRAAREAAGMTLREFARYADGPAFKTWQNYETGTPIRVDRIPETVWTRVQNFVNKHMQKTSQSTKNEKK